MFKTSCVFFALLLSYTCYGQNLKSITAQVVDAESNAPVAFAHILALNKVVVTNQSGRFTILYSEKDVDANVQISCVGYGILNTTLGALLVNSTIVIKPETKLLPELVVAELTAKKIFKKAENKGFKNYRTRPYYGNYTLEKMVFYDDDASVLAVSRDSGEFLHQGLDTLGKFPTYNILGSTMSEDFLMYDTLRTVLSAVSNQRNHISFETLYSFDPINIGLLKKLHPLPALFSEGFYDHTDQKIISIVPVGGIDHYLIAVYPKIIKAEDNVKLKNEMDAQALKTHRDKLKELAKMAGKNFSDRAIDSMITNNLLKNRSVSAVLGFFLINAEDFSVSHAVIKVNTFDSAGKPFSKLHVSASYENINKKYYLKNLDVIVKRTPPAHSDKLLYYYYSLTVSDIELVKGQPSLSTVSTDDKNVKVIRKDKWYQTQLIKNNYFFQPIMNCGNCPINPITYLNGVF
ncbi:MAG: hypothetical protein EBR30_05430 [Cytophagia bacterium]|nr:hypothetical protein [Cytophagia bacterium]